jgi:hypothetical protein
MSILVAAADTPGMEVTKDLGKLGSRPPPEGPFRR